MNLLENCLKVVEHNEITVYKSVIQISVALKSYSGEVEGRQDFEVEAICNYFLASLC